MSSSLSDCNDQNEVDSDRPTPETSAAPLPASREGVEDILATCAQEFLEILNPAHARWGEQPDQWVYRGQSNAEWALNATADRMTRDDFWRFGVPPRAEPEDSHRGRLAGELLEYFADALNRAGISIPAPSPFRILEYRGGRLGGAVVNEAIEARAEAELPFVALAQHHGIPTSLLDWSRRAWVAAYFAAAGVSEAMDRAKRDGKQLPTHLAVWALFRGDRRGFTPGLMFYEPPTATNPNLFAQSGLFTLLWQMEAPSSNLEDWGRRTRNSPHFPIMLRRCLLDVRHAPELLRLLALHGITGASMFPGADGVVREMKERGMWDRNPFPRRRPT